MSTWQTAENEVFAALSKVAETHHVAMNGTPGEGNMIVFRVAKESVTTESDVPIMSTIYIDAYVYQYTYNPTVMDDVVAALNEVGWVAMRGEQTLDSGYYRDTISAVKRYNYNLEGE